MAHNEAFLTCLSTILTTPIKEKPVKDIIGLANQIKQLDNLDLQELVAHLSSDYTGGAASTMGAMEWIYNTAGNNVKKDVPIRVQAEQAALTRAR